MESHQLKQKVGRRREWAMEDRQYFAHLSLLTRFHSGLACLGWLLDSELAYPASPAVER